MVVVEVGADEVDEGVNEEGADVFDEEDGAPCDLGAWRDVNWEVDDVWQEAAYRGLLLEWLRLRTIQCLQLSRSACWE